MEAAACQRKGSALKAFWGSLTVCVANSILITAITLPGLAKAEEPREVTVSGAVVDTSGKPVAGADVFFASPGTDPGWRLLAGDYMDFMDAPPVPATIASTRSDSQGFFSLRVPSRNAQVLQGMTHGSERTEPVAAVSEDATVRIDRGMLWAFSPLHRVGKLAVETAGKQIEPVRLVLEQPGDFQVKIVDPQGAPVVGAKLTVTGLNDLLPNGVTTYSRSATPQPPTTLRSRWTVTSNNDGLAKLSAVSWDEVRSFDVEHPSFGRQSCLSDFFMSHEGQVRLRAAKPVRGRLVADDPAVVRGVTIRFQVGNEGRPGKHDAFVTSTVEATTDQDGRFKTPLIAEGQLNVVIPEIEMGSSGRPKYLLERCRRSLSMQMSDLELKLQRAVRVHGTVRERGSGKGVPKVWVVYQITHGQETPALTYTGVIFTDENGRFAFDDLPAACIVALDGFCVTPWEGKIPSGAAEFVLPPFDVVSVRGRVVDQSGRPAAWQSLKCYWRPKTRAGAPLHIPLGIDQDGAFRIWCEPDCSFSLASIGQNGEAVAKTTWIDVTKLPNGTSPDLILAEAEPQ